MSCQNDSSPIHLYVCNLWKMRKNGSGRSYVEVMKVEREDAQRKQEIASEKVKWPWALVPEG